VQESAEDFLSQGIEVLEALESVKFWKVTKNVNGEEQWYE